MAIIRDVADCRKALGSRLSFPMKYSYDGQMCSTVHCRRPADAGTAESRAAVFSLIQYYFSVVLLITSLALAESASQLPLHYMGERGSP